MSSPVNPLIGGLFNAMNIANLIQRGKRENEQLALQKQSQADQEERQNADLSMKLSAAGARPVTPSDDLESQLGHKIDFTNGLSPEGLPTQVPVFSPSDIGGRMVKVGGGRYVLPSKSERDAQESADQEKSVAYEGQKEGARAKARGDAANTSLAQRLQSGGEVTPEIAKYTGLKVGQRFLLEHSDDIARAVAAGKASERAAANTATKVTRSVDDAGNVHLIKPDGTETVVEGAGKKTKATLPRAGGQLTPNQQITQQTNQTASQFFADAGGDPAKAEAAAKASTDPEVRKNMLGIVGSIRKMQAKPKTLANMTADEALAEFGKLAGGEQTPPAKTPAAAAPAAAASQAPRKTVPIAQVKKYAMKKKIDLKTATAEFAQSGYDVSQ